MLASSQHDNAIAVTSIITGALYFLIEGALRKKT